jgi:hypothetical protein
MDPMRKKDLLNTFHTEQVRRRDNKQTSIAGKARLLHSQKDLDGLYHLLTDGDFGDNGNNEEQE